MTEDSRFRLKVLSAGFHRFVKWFRFQAFLDLVLWGSRDLGCQVSGLSCLREFGFKVLGTEGFGSSEF